MLRMVVAGLALILAPSIAHSGPYLDCDYAPDLNKKIRGCTVVIEKESSNKKVQSMAYNNRGIAYHRMGQSERAIADFTKSYEINPKYTDAKRNRGIAYKQTGRLDLALSDFNDLLLINPRMSQLYCDRGTVFEAKGMLKEALADYTRVVKVRPTYAPAFNSRGNVYLELLKFDLAVKDYTEAISIRPGHAPTYYNRGNAYRRQNQQVRRLRAADRQKRYRDQKNTHSFPIKLHPFSPEA